MKIMYVTSECAPFIKTGGLGDVAGSLPKALAAKGHDVRVFCPLYSAISEEMREKFFYIKNAYVRLGWRNQYCGIFRYEKDGVTYYFIDNEYYFARGQIYGEYDDAERFAYYSKAVLEVLPDLDWKPDVINCNDWQTALVPVYYNLMFASRPFYENIKTVFTIHNIQYQGRYGREILEYVLGIDDAHFRSGFMAMDGDVNLMKAAIVASTAVTTVSPSYAEEIQTEYYGYRLDSVLRMNSYKLHGILNGIDMDAFNPQTDTKIFKQYGPKTPEDKLVNKTELLKLCGLEGDANTPVIGIVTRFVDQKGLDLVEAVLPDILSDDVRLVVLGTGDWKYEQMFIEAKRRWPDKVSASIMFSGDLANRIYVPDAVQVRAVRSGADDRAALRQYSDRPRDRRPQGHRPCLCRLRRHGQRLQLRKLQCARHAARDPRGLRRIPLQQAGMEEAHGAGHGERLQLGQLG